MDVERRRGAGPTLAQPHARCQGARHPAHAGEGRDTDSLMVYVLGLASAFFYGLASVMQHREAAAAPQSESLSLRLLARLVRRPLWTAGIVADAAAFALHAAALGRGPLTLVQPLLTAGLLFALALAALWERQRL